jgi:G3E family GTPase
MEAIRLIISQLPAWPILVVGLVATFLLSNAIAACLERARSRRIERKVLSLKAGSGAAGRPIPVTILTGFLGAGKTVLLNKLLSNPGERRICVIENEAGAVSIDHALLETPATGQAADTIVLKNGCVCCSASGPGSELERTLDKLLELRSGKSDGSKGIVNAAAGAAGAGLPFDYLIIELSGLADPGPVVSTFLRPEVADSFTLDGVVAVVDAKNIGTHLAGSAWASRGSEASRQVALADVILLNKVDVASTAQVREAQTAIADINPAASVRHTRFCDVPAGEILGIECFSAERASAVLLGGMQHATASFGTGHHVHTAATALTLLPAGPLAMSTLTPWLQSTVSARWRDMYRVKGILWVVPEGESRPLPFVIHGVHADVQGGFDERLRRADFAPALILIGRGLEPHGSAIRESFAQLPVVAGVVGGASHTVSAPAATGHSHACDSACASHHHATAAPHAPTSFASQDTAERNASHSSRARKRAGKG